MNKEYLMTIELEKGKEQVIIINNNTNPEELAFNFSKLYNLNFKAMNYLINEIKKVKQNFYEEKTNSNTIKLTSLNSSLNDNETNNLLINNINDDNNKILQKNISNENQKNNYKKNYLIKSKSDVKILKKNLRKNNNNNNLFFENHFYNKNNNIISYNKFYNNLKNQILNNNNKRLNTSSSINKFTYKNYKMNNNNDNKNNNIIINKKTRNLKTSLKNKNNTFNKSFQNNLHKKDNNLNNNKNLKISKNNISQNNNKTNNNNEKINKKEQKENLNYGKLLYEKSLKLREMEKINKEALKNSLINPEPKNKFIPKINPKSKKIAKKLNNNKNFDFNSSNYKIYLENKSKKLNEKFPTEKYSYTPKLNKNSLKIENLKHSKINRIEKLYKSKSSENFYKNLKNIESNMYEKYTFKPNLTMKKKNSKKFINQNLSFDERQKIYYKNSKEKKLKIINENNNSFDKITGQKLFHPIINNKKNDEIFSNKYKQNNNIYDILYSYAEIYNNKKRNKINENNNNYVITDINSNKIFEKKKLKIFSYIFNKLDSCSEGSINILNMDLKKLPISIINILNPIFKEIKESDEKINKINFIEGCFKLFDDLDYNQKNTIINYGNEISNKINNNKNFNNNFSFHPIINNNSIKIDNEIILNEFNTNKIKKNEEEFDSSY